MKELMENQNSIVFIDELHTLVGAGSAEGSLDGLAILLRGGRAITEFPTCRARA